MGKTKKHYDDLMNQEVSKFSEQDVDYRRSGEDEDCGNCIHFMVRNIDHLGVCEIVRPEEDGIDPDWVCDFWTSNGRDFPLLK